MPAILQVREQIQESVPAASLAVPKSKPDPSDNLTIALIVRWEISDRLTYARRYQGIACPGEVSGPTWGIGYDGGHQTRHTIQKDWQEHVEVKRLQSASGAVGAACMPVRRALVDVLTQYQLAEKVFTRTSLPAYTNAARRALGPEFDSLSAGARASLRSLGYNRGWSMAGDRRREIRNIRNVCVPNHDSACIASELISMCRLWPNTPGLCNRRKDEARTALVLNKQ